MRTPRSAVLALVVVALACSWSACEGFGVPAACRVECVDDEASDACQQCLDDERERRAEERREREEQLRRQPPGPSGGGGSGGGMPGGY